MLRDAGVRGKLFAVLAIPTVLLVVTSGWLVGGQVQAARQAGQIEAVTGVALQLNRVVHSLQLERTVTLDYLQGVTAGGLGGVQGQRQYTNSQLRILGDKIAASPLHSMSASIQAAAARSAKAHNELLSVRKSIDSGTLPTADSDAAYGKIIANDLQLPGAIAGSASPELAQRLQAEQALSTTIESASHERDLIELAYLDGKVTEAEFGQVSTLIAQQTQSLQDFQRLAPIQLFVALDAQLKVSDTKQLNKSRGHLTDFLKGREPDFIGSVEWQKAANPRIASMVTTEGQLVTDIANVAASIQSSEQLKASIFGATALFGLVLAILLALLLGQRITLPLRRLTLAAAEIGEELPRMVERMQTPGEGPGVIVDPIPVEGGDEIGRLAAAFNTVNEVTLRVAKEQAALRASIAEMFVNVARRNQVLLGRQLAQLDKMEAREENPDLLKNLFRLDHLATRMRRNAESLLVLAGIDSTRRLREAMPLSDVIRTAVGEIEAYERIDSSVADDPDISGRHALSVAHLIAELLENATVFSNPDTRVVVASAMTGHGVDVMITDYGLGMSDEEIAQANERIANPPLAEIAVSQRLGLFVVGRIAARLGATASLRKGRTSGTVVSIGLPLGIFEGHQIEEPVTVDHPVETAATSDDVVIGSPLDEPVLEDALVGSVPQLVSVATAAPNSAPMAEVALFNPSEVALSRLPQVDVAALAADAAADVHFASPVPTDSTRRRLLPRRSRSDEPAGPPDGPPGEATQEAEVPVEEVVAVVADIAPSDVTDDFSPLDVSAVDAAEYSPTQVPATELADVELADVELADVELADVELADVELADAEPPEIDSSARRRGSFFQRRRPKSPTEPTEVQQLDVAAVEPAAGADDAALPEVLEERTPGTEWLVDEGLRHASQVDSDVSAASDAPVADAPVVVPATRLSRRRSGRGRRGEPAVEPRTEESPAEQSVVEEPPAYEPTAYEPAAVEPVGFETAGLMADETSVGDAVVEELDDEVAHVAPARRRGLFGRRQWVADKSVAEESVSALAPLPDAEEPVIESHTEAPAAEELFTPVFDTAPPQFAWPLVDEPLAVEPDPVEPVAVEPYVLEPVAEPVVAEPVVAEPVVAEPVDAASVVEEPVDDVVTEEPTRRRGLFGRRQRAAAETVAIEEPDSEPVDAEVALAPAPEAPVREPFPSAAPEPVPVASLYFVPAIDILPGRAMGRRGKHATPVQSYAIPATPAAPVTTYAANAPAVPVVAPPVAAPQFAAPLPQRGLTSAAPSAPPRQASAPASTPSPVEPSPFEQVAVEQTAVEEAVVERSPFDYPPKEADQPMVSATMSDLDQLALNAELQKSALSELRSLYEPAFNQGTAPAADAGLIRRQRRAVEAPVESEPQSDIPARSRDAVEVRGMLSGFRAGVERGRSASNAEPHEDERGERSTTGGVASAAAITADDTTADDTTADATTADATTADATTD
jgi:Nitrate and nitrite sensing/HAMP domain